jgi:hypothetical protein
LFGDVPLTLSSNYQINQSLGRTAKEVIYDQMVSDLKIAQEKLPVVYAGGERTRPNKYAATALLARIYLYRNEWAKAEAEASSIIQSGMYNLQADLNNVFLANSSESIWQLYPVIPLLNTWEGNQIIPFSATSPPTYLLTEHLLSSFEPGDQRKTAWIIEAEYNGQTLHHPFKYKINSAASVTEYYMMIRYAEAWLIRAEARARRNNLTGAKDDLNVIRNRASLENTTAGDQTEILSAIEQERRSEFFAEWGHRWLDLKRTGRATAVLENLKPTTWDETDVLWPVPQSQINLNPALIQNPGY